MNDPLEKRCFECGQDSEHLNVRGFCSEICQEIARVRCMVKAPNGVVQILSGGPWSLRSMESNDGDSSDDIN